MQLTTTLATFVALTASAIAGPLKLRESPPAPSEIYPSTTSQYNVWSGAITYSTPKGKIHKGNGSPDITTLVTFEFPSTLPAGAMCELVFDLDSTATLSGSERAQVFTSLKPATGSTTSWPPGNLRDNHVGDFKFVKPGRAIVEATYGPTNPFPCPAGHTLGGELVGRWDNVDVEWDVILAGPKILVTY